MRVRCWFICVKLLPIIKIFPWRQVCLFCVQYCYAGVIELLRLAGCIGDPSILHNVHKTNAYVYCRRQHRAYRQF